MNWLFAIATMLLSPLLLLGYASYRSFFPPRKSHPSKALRLLNNAMAIVHAYERDAVYRPTAQELADFQLLLRTFNCHTRVLGNIVLSFERRAHSDQ